MVRKRGLASKLRRLYALKLRRLYASKLHRLYFPQLLLTKIYNAGIIAGYEQGYIRFK